MRFTASRLGGLTSVIAALLSCAVVSGCAMQTNQSDNESTGDTSQALSAFWRASWGTTQASIYNAADLGPIAGRTCFLAGVAGNLSAGEQWSSRGVMSEAAIEQHNGHYWLVAGGGADAFGAFYNNPVNAHAACVYTKPTGGASLNGLGEGQTVIASVAPGRQCFLDGIYSVTGLWTSAADYVKVWHDNTNWYLSTNMTKQGQINGVGDSFGFLNASAVCLDAPAGASIRFPPSISADDPGYTNYKFLAWEGDTAASCGLTGIQGHFTANDWNDGAMLNWPSASNPEWWSATVENGKTAWSACIK
jgi:hypothetical protein